MYIPSPAISFVGRHNSGKTTLIERVIAQLTARGYDVGSVKHHHHSKFDIDHPGKDSYRHRAAGATETVIASPTLMARIKTLDEEVECSEIVRSMPGHDIVVVEGYRKSGLPCIEIMRAENEADANVARVFVEGAKRGFSLDTDFTQFLRGLTYIDSATDQALIEAALDTKTPVSQLRGGDDAAPGSSEGASVGASPALGTSEDASASASPASPGASPSPDASPASLDIAQKMPTSNTVAVVTNIPEVETAAQTYGIKAFPLNDVTPLVDFIEEYYVRPHVTVVIQAGGESRRMGRSKATVPFGGRPMICRLIERLAPAADELVITTNEAPSLEFVHEMYPDLNIRLVKDEYDFRGALPGLYTALKAAISPYVAVVACDMVLASASLVCAEAIEMNESKCDVVVPVNKHGFEPFHALYRKETCLPAIKERLDQGNKRAQSFFDLVDVKEFAHSRVLEAEPMGGCFVNANTPEELARLEDICFD